MRKKIAIVGLGYVGLPLAVEFGKFFTVTGYDIDKIRVSQLKEQEDITLEVSHDEFQGAENLQFTDSLQEITDAQIYIITVPTPIDKFNNPDLKPLQNSSKDIGSVLKKGDIVIYESTVFPGCTEEECVPILEEISGLKFNQDFFVGYSPERINPGDKERRLPTIKKVVSGSTLESAKEINELYLTIITAGTHLASSLKVAEASKIIENTQRDVNISFMNELAMIFDRLDIDTNEVLEAAGTKWNFLKYQPGLVGGHCISIDPYYLAQKAAAHGYHPELILAGRKINDQMGVFIASKVVKIMIKKGQRIQNAKVLVAGVTFKENCPDIRNSKVIDLIDELSSFGCDVQVYDPWANAKEVEHEYNVSLIKEPAGKYDAIIISVPHQQFLEYNWADQIADHTVVFDVKGILPRSMVDARL